MRSLEQARDAFSAVKEKTYRTVTDLNISVIAKPKSKDVHIEADTLEHIAKLKAIYPKMD